MCLTYGQSHTEASGLNPGAKRRVVKEIQLLLGARPPPPNREIAIAGLHLWEAHAATMAHFVFLVEAPDEASPYRGTGRPSCLVVRLSQRKSRNAYGV